MAAITLAADQEEMMFTATRTTTMKAITGYGGPEQLRLVQRAVPQPADDEFW